MLAIAVSVLPHARQSPPMESLAAAHPAERRHAQSLHFVEGVTADRPAERPETKDPNFLCAKSCPNKVGG